jgi:hypothetical protein
MGFPKVVVVVGTATTIMQYIYNCIPETMFHHHHHHHLLYAGH